MRATQQMHHLEGTPTDQEKDISLHAQFSVSGWEAPAAAGRIRAAFGRELRLSRVFLRRKGTTNTISAEVDIGHEHHIIHITPLRSVALRGICVLYVSHIIIYYIEPIL